jgi:hypothetical protein
MDIMNLIISDSLEQKIITLRNTKNKFSVVEVDLVVVQTRQYEESQFIPVELNLVVGPKLMARLVLLVPLWC